MYMNYFLEEHIQPANELSPSLLDTKRRRTTQTSNSTNVSAATSDNNQMSPSLIEPTKYRVVRHTKKSSVRLNDKFDSTL